MNLKPEEISALIRNYAKQIQEGIVDQSIDRERRAMRRSELNETIERMLQLAKELP